MVLEYEGVIPVRYYAQMKRSEGGKCLNIKKLPISSKNVFNMAITPLRIFRLNENLRCAAGFEEKVTCCCTRIDVRHLFYAVCP